LAIVVISLPIILMAAIFGRVAVSLVRGLWRRTAGRPLRRAAAGALVLSMAAGLAYAWWPDAERYQPVRPYEHGTLLSVASVPLGAAGVGLSAPPPVDGGEMVTVLPSSAPLPSQADPQLALVLVPKGSATPDGGIQPGASGAIQPAWVFPFNEPLPPEPGDNQAGAFNTTDDSVLYDVAVAMVWVTGEDPVLNVNEAYAFASCADCVTVAVAFQVVVIVGSADVVVPQNLSAALNYECFQCITAAIASQLVVTVDALPGVEQQIALADVWEDITAFASSIPTMSLADIISQLEGYKGQILTILAVAPLATPSPTPLPFASPTTSGSPTSGATPSEDPSIVATPEASVPPQSSRTSSPEPTPVPTPDATSQPTVSPEPSVTPSSS
jgi:putative peptide zinc metalloprotease protein